MTDSGQLQSRFLAGGRLAEAGINVSADRIPLCTPQGTISPADFWIATGGGAIPSNVVTLRDGTPVVDRAGSYVTLR